MYDVLGAEIDWTAGLMPGTTQNVDPSAPGAAGTYDQAIGTGSGRYGFQTVTDNTSSNPFIGAWQWLNSPFQTPLSIVDLFWIIGAVLIAFLLWNLILYHVRIAAEAI
jgi:hypothetical protein